MIHRLAAITQLALTSLALANPAMTFTNTYAEASATDYITPDTTVNYTTSLAGGSLWADSNAQHMDGTVGYSSSASHNIYGFVDIPGISTFYSYGEFTVNEACYLNAGITGDYGGFELVAWEGDVEASLTIVVTDQTTSQDIMVVNRHATGPYDSTVIDTVYLATEELDPTHTYTFELFVMIELNTGGNWSSGQVDYVNGRVGIYVSPTP